MAWIRPGGTVWRLVESSPCRMRSPSGESVMVKSQSVETRRQMAWRMTMANEKNSATPEPDGRPVAVGLAQQAQGWTDEQQHQPPRDHFEQDGADQAAVGDREDGALRCLGDARVGPGRPGEQVGAQELGHRTRQVAEPDGGALGAGRGHLELGQPEDASGERLEDVDALHPVEPDPLRLLL